MDKVIEIQRQMRQDASELETSLRDLKNWESEMKRKEAALNGQIEQVHYPPVRSKIKKEKPVVKPKKLEKRIASSDYTAWDKFDVEKACKDVDMSDLGPSSLDGAKSKTEKEAKLREEALYEKERGNTFVKAGKWDEALTCYNRAIELVKDDAIYYANRGLCHLKKESFRLAEADCTESLRLDPTYVKALQRRAHAREKQGSLRAASQDLIEVIRLEPYNAAAKRELEVLKKRMGTKGTKSKASPTSSPKGQNSSKIIELESPTAETANKKHIVEVPSRAKSEFEDWKNGVGENVTVIIPVKKPPHLRSKRPLKQIPITEIPLGVNVPPANSKPTRIKIEEIEDGQGDHIPSQKQENLKINNSNASGDHKIPENKTSPKDLNETNSMKLNGFEEKDKKLISNGQDSDKAANDVNKIKHNDVSTPESDKLKADMLSKFNNNDIIKVDTLKPPANSVQFLLEWKSLKGTPDGRSTYLNIIEPNRLPAIFHNSMESDLLSEIIDVLHDNMEKFKSKGVANYLKGLSGVKRLSALVMFLSAKEKIHLNNLLQYCATNEGCAQDEINDLKSRFEL